MCECLKRPDGTWHVDECCAFVMDEFHSGRPEKMTEEISRLRYWLVRLYIATHRYGWEGGPSEDVTFAELNDVLSNCDLCPENNRSKVAELLSKWNERTRRDRFQEVRV